MHRLLLVISLVVLVSCTSHSILRFSIDIKAGEEVDPIVARKIVLTWLLQRPYQLGGAKVQVNKIPVSAEARCNEITGRPEVKLNVCGAKYVISTPWVQNEGYSSYFVYENCSAGECTYRVSTEDYGIEE